MSNVDDIFNELEKDLELIDPDLAQWNIEYFHKHKNRYLNDLRLINKHYQKGGILEIGSLPCHMTYCLQRLSYPVVGIDIDPDRSGQFIKKHRLKIHKCDVENEKLPLEDEAFGFVVFNEIFEHLRINPIKTLNEIQRVMKPGGILILTTPNLYSIANIIKFNLGKGINDPYNEFEKIEKLGHMGHVREYSTKEVAKFLEKTGFTVSKVNYTSYDKLDKIFAHQLLKLYLSVFPKQNLFQTIIATK